MTELTPTQRADIRAKITKERTLRSILEEEHPHAMLAIIRGRDNFSHENYTKGAYLSEEKALSEMTRIPPNGTLPDTYSMVQISPWQLKSARQFDDIDRLIIYEELEKLL